MMEQQQQKQRNNALILRLGMLTMKPQPTLVTKTMGSEPYKGGCANNLQIQVPVHVHYKHKNVFVSLHEKLLITVVLIHCVKGAYICDYWILIVHLVYKTTICKK